MCVQYSCIHHSCTVLVRSTLQLVVIHTYSTGGQARTVHTPSLIESTSHTYSTVQLYARETSVCAPQLYEPHLILLKYLVADDELPTVPVEEARRRCQSETVELVESLSDRGVAVEQRPQEDNGPAAERVSISD